MARFYTEDEITRFEANPYVISATDRFINFTAEFKHIFYSRYQETRKPKRILESLGFDIELLGYARIHSVTMHVVKEYQSIHGIGPKTVDYLRMLSGCQAIAIDRHLFAFLELAGILNCTYQEASIIYNKSSELLHMSKYEINKSIWQYMSQTQIG